MGSLIAFVIVALLVFGGVQSVMDEMAHAYAALAASQAETTLTQSRLDNARLALAHTQAELDSALQANQRQARQLQLRSRALVHANDEIEALTVERNDLKRGMREAVQIMAQSHRDYKAVAAEYRAAKAEIEQIKQQPKLSVVVTTERQFAMSQRERAAASQVKLYAQGDAGAVYYASAKAFREKEKHVRYTERSQVVLTQTGPGDDVLRCLRDGCAMVLAAQQSAMHMESYSYQAQSVSSEMLMVDNRRR
ncbi:MAG: hypothetical protein OXG92_15570 [Chloroflexi bacterium]|nr:hypothetical protein [Chloroflexota bacterium]MCY3583706.1 hypothetical protein [Chloroflexota bacterium]MCY3717868.1 hypothetical protein [Chloroflexota bacterium]MDE2649776.1 hypothetical protein [Chloroflexota bacterium]MXV92254.1 hypothetical protein [Chloroflexota bacterium]